MCDRGRRSWISWLADVCPYCGTNDLFYMEDVLLQVTPAGCAVGLGIGSSYNAASPKARLQVPLTASPFHCKSLSLAAPSVHWDPPGQHIQADLQHAQRFPLHHIRIPAAPVSAGAGNPGNPQCHLRRHPGVQRCAQDSTFLSCSPAFPLTLLRTARIPRLPVEDPMIHVS